MKSMLQFISLNEKMEELDFFASYLTRACIYMQFHLILILFFRLQLARNLNIYLCI